MTSGITGLQPWPGDCCDVNFGGIRLWDSGTAWYLLNPSSGTYNWTTLDAWLADAQKHGVDVIYTFGELPTWASSNPTDEYCAVYQQDPGACDPPNDLNADGTGRNQHWKDFVTAVVTHANGQIHYWETWNEASNAGQKGKKGVGQWKGTNAQLLRMAKDARTIIKKLDPSAVILSPSTRLNVPNDYTWLSSYLAAGGGKYADAIALHGYVQGKGAPVPEMLINLLHGPTGYRQILKKYHQGKKPVFDTESSWGVAANTGLTDADEQAGFLARLYLLHRLEGLARLYWYEWDNRFAGTLWSPADAMVVNGATGDNTASALLGIGNGSFYKPVAYSAGTGPVAVTVGDLNNDGRADLAIANGGDATVSVLLGNGDGTFQSAVPYSVGNSPSAVATGDFNNDGNLDLAVTDGSDNAVSVLLGNGDGTFQIAVPYGTDYSPALVAVGDFDKNGTLDLAIANACGTDQACHHSGTVTVLLGNGDGTFQSAVSYPVGRSPLSIVAGDLDNDGNLDVAETDKLDNTVSVLWGNGDGSFQKTASTFATDGGPNSVIAADFNRDGLLDLAVANRGTNDVSILLNSGKRGFAGAKNYDVGGFPYSIAARDFIGDGFLDLVTANQKSDNVSVLMGNGDGTFKAATASAAGDSPVSVAVGAFEVFGDSDPGTLLKPGCAYRTSYSWMVGTVLDNKACSGPLPPETGVWSCNLTGPKGYKAQAVWDTSQSCKNGVCTTSDYQVKPKYKQFVTVYGQVLPVQNSTVKIGYRPILLENQKRPMTTCQGE